MPHNTIQKSSALQSPTRALNLRALLVLWGMTAVTCLAIFYPFLFGDKLIVFNDAASDTRQQYLMQYATIVNHLRSGNLSFWDLSNGFGASMFSLNLFNVFLIPIYLYGCLRGIGHLPTALLFMEIAQIFLAGTFCYLYLSRFTLSQRSRVLASYLYACSGYLIVWGQHYQFGAFVVLFPLLLFLLERAMQRRKCSFAVPLLVAVLVVSGVYMSYMVLLLTGFYLLYRAVYENGNRPARVRMFLTHCGEIVLGIGIGAVIFLPSAYWLLTASTRLDSGESFLQHIAQFISLFPSAFYRTALLRFFSTTFEGITDYQGYSNFYEAPVLFFSVLFVFLALQYVCTIHRQETTRKSRILQYAAVLFAAACLFTCLGSSAFNAFAYPFSRHTFLFMPLFALVAAQTLDQILIRRRFSFPALLLFALLCAYVYPTALQRNTERALQFAAVVSGLIALLTAVLLFLGWRFAGTQPRRVRIAALLLTLCTVANVTAEGWLCYNRRNLLTTEDPTYWGGLYNPNVTEALNYVRENDPSLVRVEKDYFSGSYCMDGMAQGYRGISAYNSTPNRNIEEFVNLVIPNFPIMAVYEYTFRQIGYYTGHSTLFGIKYLLSQNPALELDGFRRIAQFGETDADNCVYLYQNDNVSSFARFYTRTGDSAVLARAYGKADLETMLLDVALLDCGEDAGTAALAEEVTGKKMLSRKKLLSRYPLEEIAVLEDIAGDGSSDSVSIPIDRKLLDGYENVYLEFEVTTPEVSDFILNPDYPMEYHFRTLANRPRSLQAPIPPAAEEITLSRYGGMFDGTIRSIRLVGSRRTPKENSGAVISIGDTANDSRISGTVTAESGGFLFLPIPYESGWSAALDGEEAELLRTDAGFVSIPVPEGEHSFVFTYRQPLMREGLWISIFSLALWAALLILRRARTKSALRAKTGR